MRDTVVARPDIDAIKGRLAAAPIGALSRDPTGARLLLDLKHVIAWVEEIEYDEQRKTAPIPESVEL